MHILTHKKKRLSIRLEYASFDLDFCSLCVFYYLELFNALFRVHVRVCVYLHRNDKDLSPYR